MAEYTVAELKDLTSVSTVSNWSDTKILQYQTTAEAILAGLGLDTTMTGYSTMYSSAVLPIFEWLADNPTNLKSLRSGKVAKGFFETLPPMVQVLVGPFVLGAEGTLTGALMKRQDVGRR